MSGIYYIRAVINICSIHIYNQLYHLKTDSDKVLFIGKTNTLQHILRNLLMIELLNLYVLPGFLFE